MAAKPPKPPGNFLKESSVSKNIPTTTTSTTTNNSNEDINVNCATNTLEKEEEDEVTSNANVKTSAAANCNCTNISIMHLFHEMKQEFPTIPDPIVAQCVNENCHQRENCIQMLRKELALNPIPVQTYPAKVLYQQRQQQQQQQNFNNNSNKPAKPLKPIRVAPLNPPNVKNKPFYAFKNSNNNNSHINNNNNINSNCDNVSEVLNNGNEDNDDLLNASDMPTTKSIQVNKIVNNNGNNRVNSDVDNDLTTTTTNGIPNSPVPQPRARPTTLNLQSSQIQQQQRQQLHVQLQQHLQQRNNCKQPQPQQTPSHQKPLRKAPLPPILPPKPTQFQIVAAAAPPPPLPPPHSTTINRNTTQQQQLEHSNSQQSFSNDSTTSTLTSPTSSIGGSSNIMGESEISVNVSLTSPTIQQKQLHPQLKSPVRHRAVITVKPEPPYTRDFLADTAAPATTPTTQSSTPQTSGSTSFASNINSPKSFTSVNLTLRQPNVNSAVPQSTIDISAGPGLSGGQTSGLTYSSTSYDARRGFQKNFHITVTDEGGVFSASRIRPRGNQFPGVGGHEAQDVYAAGNGSGGGGGDNGGVSPLRATATEQNHLQQQQKQHYQHNSQKEQQKQQQQILANKNNNSPRNNNKMCHPREISGFPEIIQRQKERRDKLATVVRDKKKRLSQIEQEINLLTEPIQPGQAERLDNDLQRLRCDCQAMWSEVENARRSSGPPIITYNQSNQFTYNYQPLQQQNQTEQSVPQPFPRQRPPRPPLGIVRQPHLDFVQHHGNNNAATTPTASTNAADVVTTPPTYEQYLQSTLTNDDDYSDSNNTDTGEEDEEDYWACNMCTFRNHPQLNICECCENVRILPGTIRIVPNSAAAATVAAAAAAAAVSGVPSATTSTAPSQTAAAATTVP